MGRKDSIFAFLCEQTESFISGECCLSIDATSIADELKLARYNVSRDLNKLAEEGQVLKFSGRPVCFLAKELIERYVGKKDEIGTGMTLEEMRKLLNKYSSDHLNDYPFTELIGYNGSLENAIRQAKAALLYPPFGLHSILTGPSGSGKTTFARFMYQYAKHAGKLQIDAPYVIFNCADYSNNQHLLLDHLFGHVKHAFTGADSDKDGLISAANNGILFLDEIHRLPPEGQEMLFSIMDRGEYYRLGESSNPRKVRVLIIGATTEEFEGNILTTFLRRIPLKISMPSIKERGLAEKIKLIYFCFKQEAQKIERKLQVNEDVIRFFIQYNPVGNIGQMKNDIQLLCANALVDSISINSELIQVKLSHLSTYLIDQFYYAHSSETNSELREKLKFLQIDEFIFAPEEESGDDPFLLVDEEESVSYEVLETYHKYLDGKSSLSPLKSIIHGKARELAEKQGNQQQAIFKIVSRKNYEVTVNILKSIAARERYHLEESNIKSLALHLDTLIEKITEGYSFRDNSFLEHKRPNELAMEKEIGVAEQICREISNQLEVQLPESEKYFISLYLKAMNEKYTEKKIGVLILMHGTSAATDLANTANQLLNVDHAVGLNMPLSQSVGDTLEKATELIKQVDQGKGVVILSDMGSLNMFGDIITKKTGIPTKTIKMVTTPMVIEATRKSLLPKMSITELSEDIVEQSAYIGNSVEDFQEKTMEEKGTMFTDDRRSKIICILEESLIFLDGTTIYDLLEVEAKKIAKVFQIKHFEDFWIKFLFHTSNMIERAIRKEQFLREDIDIILESNRELYQYLKDLLMPLENRYAIIVEDSEISYLMELIEVNTDLVY
ncbi:sigma-54-dependent transcriptional regulator [Enterococcus casseliflavus]|uniref:sigma-54-dependent transcriptional regulator n=1 Tax=Enterococcus casseliflavus TaxID=37734 RepID=UPI0003545C33|nr:sigma 54-interacting transcriptional regulator [Enterococcus casseliflavus]EPH65515.1 transcriptional regulatory protein LevR family protein [Enterococcus casseliflavus 14-MB-W-14]